MLADELGRDEIYAVVSEKETSAINQYAKKYEEGELELKENKGKGKITAGGRPHFVPAYKRIRQKMR